MSLSPSPALWSLALLLAPTAALSADDMIISPGVLLSVSKRPSRVASGLGAELSIWKAPDHQGRTGGAFAQWQVMDLDHHRFCVGVQATYILFGLEAGATYETADEDHARTISLHMAPYVSIVYATLSLRLGIPVVGGNESRPSHGYDVGLVLALKYPLSTKGR